MRSGGTRARRGGRLVGKADLVAELLEHGELGVEHLLAGGDRGDKIRVDGNVLGERILDLADLGLMRSDPRLGRLDRAIRLRGSHEVVYGS